MTGMSYLTTVSNVDNVNATMKARAVPVTVKVWKCSACGHVTVMTDPSKPPRRCSNRKGCGAKFYP